MIAEKPREPAPETPPINLRSATFCWIFLLFYVAFIYATLGSIPTFSKWLEDRYGKEIFATLTYVGAGLASALILAHLIFRKKERRPLPYLCLAAVGIFLRHVMRNWITIPVEQIHFVEYGLVGYLCYNALRHHLRGWALVVAAFGLTYLFGMIDESLQGNIPGRVGAQQDMYWNGLAAAMGLWMVVTSLRPERIRGHSGRKEIQTVLVIAALALPVQGYFNRDIAQFGVLIRDADHHLIFRSSLPAGDLQQYHDSLGDFNKLAAQLGPVRLALLLPQAHDRIHEEALVHVFRRGYHARLGHNFIVYKEGEILDRYFHQFVEGTAFEFPPEQAARLEQALGDTAGWDYESPVADHLITKFTQRQMWAVIGLLEAGIVVMWIKMWKKHNAA